MAGRTGPHHWYFVWAILDNHQVWLFHGTNDATDFHGGLPLREIQLHHYPIPLMFSPSCCIGVISRATRSHC